MKSIGILGGMGPQASAHLLHTLTRDASKYMAIASDNDFPEIVLLSVPVPHFINNKHNLAVARNALLKRTKLLEQAGCVVNGIACNTAHLLLDDLRQSTAVPFLSIPLLVNQIVTERNFRRVGLLATSNTLHSRLYDEAIDSEIQLIKPDVEMINETERLIFRRLSSEATESADSVRLHQIVDEFIGKHQLDAVILGCTELPLIFGDSSDVRVIDSLQALSDGLLQTYTSNR